MIQEKIDWSQVINIISKNQGISKTDVCKIAGIGGSATVNMISAKKTAEPLYSEGVSLLAQFHAATTGDNPPTAKRKSMSFCSSCQRNYSIDKIFRVAAGKYKCDSCIKKIAAAHQERYRERHNNE